MIEQSAVNAVIDIANEIANYSGGKATVKFVQEIIERYQIGKQICGNSRFREAFGGMAIAVISLGWTEDLKGFVGDLKNEKFAKQAFSDVARSYAMNLIAHYPGSNIKGFFELDVIFGIEDDSNEVLDFLVDTAISANKSILLRSILENYPEKNADIENRVVKILSNAVSVGDFEKAIKIILECNWHPRLKEMAGMVPESQVDLYLSGLLLSAKTRQAAGLIYTFQMSQDHIKQVALFSIGIALREKKLREALEIMLFANVRTPLREVVEKISDLRIIGSNVRKIAEVYQEEYQNYFDEPLKSSPLSFVERICVSKNPSIMDNGSINYHQVFEVFSEDMPEWQNQENAAGPFRRGAEIFGYEKMFQFVRRVDVSRHDQLYAFDNIVAVFEISGLPSEAFFGQILNQVVLDTATYGNGKSYHELNSICQRMPELNGTFFEELKEKTKRYGNIKNLQVLGDLFSDSKAVFASWANLKKFSQIIDLLAKTVVLDQLKGLADEAEADPKKEKLYHYVETLALHPYSKIYMERVFQFWQSPYQFLDLGDAQSHRSHDVKKPSNYTDIPHLDLSAEELRDALVEGSLDRVQLFSPAGAEFVLSEKTDDNLWDQFRFQLGSRKENNPNGPLFNAANQLAKKFGIRLIDYINNGVGALVILTTERKKEFESELQKLIVEYPNANLKKEQPKGQQFRVRIHPKSSPEGALAGNDTACCMFFGSGKNNIYMYNPNCAQLTVEIKSGDRYRTIAQSVLTLDQNIGAYVGSIATMIGQTGKKASDVLPESVLGHDELFLTCDNIELAKNGIVPQEVIAEIYRQFLAQYLKQVSFGRSINPDRVIVGGAYTEISGLDLAENTYLPLAPVGYSDNAGDSCLVLNMAKDKTPQGSRLSMSDFKLAEGKEAIDFNGRGIQPLTFADSLAVGYLESKAYSENESLITHLHNMENGLIAKDIANAHKGRPNLSFKHVDSSGKMDAYILAYEGRDNGEPVIYISDLASSRDNPQGVGRMLVAFLQAYKTEHPDKGDPFPITMEARHSTSYPLLMNNLDFIKRILGAEVEVRENGESDSGGEIMHNVKLIVKNVPTG